MKFNSVVTRAAVVIPAAALMFAAVPGLASAKSVQVKNGTYKGKIYGNSGDAGGDYSSPLSIYVKSKKITKIVFSTFPLWAATQPAGVNNGTAAPQGCTQAGVAPGEYSYQPTVTVRFVSSPNPVKISSKGSFSVHASSGSSTVGSPISSVTYQGSSKYNQGPAQPTLAGPTQLSMSGRFTGSKKAKGSLANMKIQMGAGIETFTCASNWGSGSLAWGIPK